MARTSPRPNYGIKRRIRKDGYIDVYSPEHPLARKDGYLFEHRQVAFDAGLLSDTSLHVHHINGNKSDNRIENLEILDLVMHAVKHQESSGVVHNQYGTWKLGTGFITKHRAAAEALGDRMCEWCFTNINHLRLDAIVCSSKCRYARWKANSR